MKESSLSPVKLLTIAGSDSGGAAGLQADLKTWTRLGVYGMSVVSVVTAQNSVGVEAVQALPADFVGDQIDAVLSDYGADGVKTGFLGSVDLIEVVAARLGAYKPGNVVVDPVLVNHRGQPMFSPFVIQAYLTELLPLADLITPNSHEAAMLAGLALPKQMNIEWLETAGRHLQAHGPKYVLVKGGRIAAESVDVFFDGSEMTIFSSPWIDTENTHGSGDTLSAAACAYLAQGKEIVNAVIMARQFTARAIQRGVSWQLGHGHGPVAQFMP